MASWPAVCPNPKAKPLSRPKGPVTTSWRAGSLRAFSLRFAALTFSRSCAPSGALSIPQLRYTPFASLQEGRRIVPLPIPLGKNGRMEWSDAHDAIEQMDADAITALLDSGSDVEDSTSDGMTLLHHAIDVEADAATQSLARLDGELTRVLVKKGADLQARWRDRTPLAAAEYRGHDVAAEILRAAMPAPPPTFEVE